MAKKRLMLAKAILLRLIFLVEALNVTRRFELVHKRTVDCGFDPNVGELRSDLRHQRLQPLHACNAGVWCSLV